MGLPDTVYLSEDVADAFDLKCPRCGNAPAGDWQTKSLDPALLDYFLRRDDNGAFRLYLLDRPSDRRFWREWTEEEIAESEEAARKTESPLFPPKKRGEGHFLREAYLPENRRQRFMGEVPHQWVELYASCECGEFVVRWLKFSDGVLEEVRHESPDPGPELYEGAAWVVP